MHPQPFQAGDGRYRAAVVDADVAGESGHGAMDAWSIGDVNAAMRPPFRQEEGVLAVGLGEIYGCLGSTQQVVGVIAVFGTAGDADDA